ncbi:hypothetical protein AYI68_g4186 [Smittium mucronatum]|uniref:Uncharacterized protein n=1 Tax=Smittium mucronatum TaxID=133383 RepID=A0A1R0GXU0_9FUNG|nr:hypothetical protein AYI68_g4186 [Smittium mucronatum]
MGIFMLKHELVESGVYPGGFSPIFYAWRWLAEDRDCCILVSRSFEVLAIGDELVPLVSLTGEKVMEYLLSSFLGLSSSYGFNTPVRLSSIIPTIGLRSKRVIYGLKYLLAEEDECISNDTLGVASTLATQKQFRSEDLFQSNWYSEPASEIMRLSMYAAGKKEEKIVVVFVINML